MQHMNFGIGKKKKKKKINYKQRTKLKRRPTGASDIKRVEETLNGDIVSVSKEEKIFCMQIWVATLVPKSVCVFFSPSLLY